MKKYKECLTRECSLFSIKSWNEGESNELKKWIGFGFFNHIFVSEDGIVTLYYNVEEGDRFHEVLKEKLTEELFHKLCDNFFELLEEFENVKNNDEFYNLSVKCWPALSIFDEISKYPEFATPLMIRRLMRIRKTTESFFYDLEKKLDIDKNPKDYIYYKGDIIEKPFNEFKKEEGIILK